MIQFFRFCTMIALLLLPKFGNAQEVAAPLDASFSIQTYEQALGHDGLFSIESAVSKGHLAYTVGFVLNYQLNPFSIFPCEPSTGGEGQPVCELNSDSAVNIVKNHFSADIFASLSLFNMVQLGIAVPVILYQNGDGIASLDENGGLKGSGLQSSTSLGDVRLHLKWTVPFGLGKGEKSGFGVAIAPTISFPTGNLVSENSFMGDGLVTVHPQILAEYRVDEIQIAGRLGYRWREDSVIYSTEIGQQLTYGIGMSYTVRLKKPGYSIRPILEIFGANGFSTDLDQSPLEVGVGLQARIAGDVVLSLNGGAGLISAVGVPTFRVVGGFMWAPLRSDADSDGVRDGKDACINEAEDMDGFEDQDGCPEMDNDSDGLQDDQDQCPTEPEDRDSHEDEDGCPDLDNDGDGINDGYDSCPMEPEDIDGYQDANGCPDLDHDRDNIDVPLDHCPYEPEDTDGFADEDGCPEFDYDGDSLGDDEGDLCPENAEDYDNFEDDDGCPEADNDQDLILDGADRCPNDAESWNGMADSDGCPERSQAYLNVQGRRIIPNYNIDFDRNEATLSGRSASNILDVVVTMARTSNDIRFRIISRTTTESTNEANQSLSERRGETVKQYLIQNGIAADRIEVQALGNVPGSGIEFLYIREGETFEEFEELPPESEPEDEGGADFQFDGDESEPEGDGEGDVDGSEMSFAN